MRNFWIETEVEGRRTVDASGPRGKNGSFLTTIRVNEKGNSVKAITIRGYVIEDNKLQLEIVCNEDYDRTVCGGVIRLAVEK